MQLRGKSQNATALAVPCLSDAAANNLLGPERHLNGGNKQGIVRLKIEFAC
jgi:hypothetical protein